jgi:hypothetical protein
VSHNDDAKITLPRETYECFAGYRAARRAAQGLPPEDPKDIPWLCEHEVEAEENQRTTPEESSTPRGRLTRAAKAKIAERDAAIPGFERHSRKCALCRHPALEEIERAYLAWHSVFDICRFFEIDDPDTIYRHVRAAQLDVARRQNVRTVVENFIEQSRHVKITSSTILRSIRALSCLDDNGRWTDPPRTHILVRGPDIASSDSRSSDSGLPESGMTSTTEIREASSAAIRMPSAAQYEPYRERKSGLPTNDSSFPTCTAEAAPTAVSPAETQRGAGQPPHSERSEPLYENSSADSSSSLATSHSSLATAPKAR